MNAPLSALPALQPTWTSRLIYDTTYWVAAGLLSLGFGLRIRGQRHIPRRGPALLVANHQSFLDPVMVGLATPRHIAPLARETLFKNRIFGWYLRQLNAVPIDQEGVGVEGMRAILDRLQAGQVVLIFPEGARTFDGQLQEMRGGVSLLIKRVSAPIVPIGLAGAYDAWPRTRAYPIPAPICFPPMPGRLAVAIGKPLDGTIVSRMKRDEMMQALTTAITAVVGEAEGMLRQRQAFK